jgi:small subunit ribosomal protein S20
MPVTKQAIKKVRQDRRKTTINLKVKKALKAAVSAFRKNPNDATLKAVFKAADTAAKTNVIHKNRASRIKSRLSKKIAKKTPAAATPKAKAKK